MNKSFRARHQRSHLKRPRMPTVISSHLTGRSARRRPSLPARDGFGELWGGRHGARPAFEEPDPSKRPPLQISSYHSPRSYSTWLQYNETGTGDLHSPVSHTAKAVFRADMHSPKTTAQTEMREGKRVGEGATARAPRSRASNPAAKRTSRDCTTANIHLWRWLGGHAGVHVAECSLC